MHRSKRLEMILILVVCSWIPGLAEAGSSLSVFGLGSFSSLHYNPVRANLSSNSKMGMGAGAQIELTLKTRNSMRLGIEIGAVYLKKKIDLAYTPDDVAFGFSANQVQVPIQLRSWIGSVFSASFGVYYARGLGELVVENSRDAEALPNGTYSYSSQGINQSEFGLVGGLAVQLPLKVINIFVEPRFTMSLSDAYSPALEGTKSRYFDIQLLAGVRFD